MSAGPREPPFSVYDGQTALGNVFDKAGRLEAVLAKTHEHGRSDAAGAT